MCRLLNENGCTLVELEFLCSGMTWSSTLKNLFPWWANGKICGTGEWASKRMNEQSDELWKLEFAPEINHIKKKKFAETSNFMHV